MNFDTVEILDGQTIENMAVESGTQIEREAKTGMNGGELFNQIDGDAGMYTYNNGWSISTSVISVTLSGLASLIGVSTIHTLTITNFNFQSVYLVEVNGGGGATIVDNTITYTSRSDAGIDTLVITQDGNNTQFITTAEISRVNTFSTLGDGGTDNHQIYYACVDSSKNTYLTSEDFTGTDTATNIKLDAASNIVWQRKYTGPSSQEGITCDDTHVYVIGYSSNVTYVNKLDVSTGNIVWEVVYAGTYRGTSIIEDGTSIYTAGPNNGIQVMKISKTDGSVIWSNDFDSPGTGSTTNGIAFYNGYVYVAARWSDTAVSGRVTKINAASGVVSWTRDLLHTSSNQTAFEGISVDNTGIYCCGWVRDSDGPRHNLIVKYDDTGTRQWVQTFQDTLSINNSLASYYDVNITGTHIYAAGTTVGVNGTNGIAVPMFSKFNIDGTLIYHSALDLASGKRGEFRTIIVEGSNLTLAGYYQPTGSFGHDMSIIVNDDDGSSLNGIPPNHTDVTWLDPTGVSNTTGTNTFTDFTPAVTPINTAITPTSTTLTNSVGTLSITKSLY